ncbi:MAG: hypothetical protein A2Y07_09715 [Planctomycetes bacterium GWF2_50_10]|nr:MAG: hypothetical protein A2Y07_09715 [Planctomycetes bacterium GWF2_50_10]
MKSRDYLIIFLCIVFAASMLVVANSQLGSIVSHRKDMKLISSAETLENAPPSIAFASVALGAFRGILVDVLWMRADNLKMQGQFFDAKQLAEWITILQPRFAEVWDFQAWNMAYNISVAMPATQPQERWRWVKNGIELLRDQAIVKNPKSISLYRSLGWIYFHKIGGVSDDVHKYYRLQLALAIKPLIDPQTNESYEKLAKAPKTWNQVISDPAVVKLVNALAQADPNMGKGEAIAANYLAVRAAPNQWPKAFEVVNRYRETTELETFDYFAKAHQLRAAWKLDPELMLELNRTYGPIDFTDPNLTRRLPLNWEHACVHSMYWGALGLKVAGKPGEYRGDEVNTDRIVFHSLQELFRTGKMVIYDTEMPIDINAIPLDQRTPDMPTTQLVKSIYLFPDLRMFDSYDRAMDAVVDKYIKLKDDPVSITNGQRNMLTNALVSFYQGGHRDYALKIYNKLRRLFPQRPEFRSDMVTFIRSQIKEELQSVTIHDAVEQIQGMLVDSYMNYALGNDDEASGREQMAREIYDVYQKEWVTEKVKRVDLPEFSMMRYLAIEAFLNDDMYPPNLRLNLIGRIKLEKPEMFKQLEIKANQLMQKEKEQQEREKAQNQGNIPDNQNTPVP